MTIIVGVDIRMSVKREEVIVAFSAWSDGSLSPVLECPRTKSILILYCHFGNFHSELICTAG